MKKSLKASYTVEASMVMPLVLFFIFQGFALGISLCQEVQKASVYSARNYRVQIFLKEAKC